MKNENLIEAIDDDEIVDIVVKAKVVVDDKKQHHPIVYGLLAGVNDHKWRHDVVGHPPSSLCSPHILHFNLKKSRKKLILFVHVIMLYVSVAHRDCWLKRKRIEK